MKKVILGFATLLALACVACGAEPSSESESESAADEALSTVDVDNTAPTVGPCPYAYTCGSRTRYYSTLTACRAACGTATCYRREVYTGHCILR